MFNPPTVIPDHNSEIVFLIEPNSKLEWWESVILEGTVNYNIHDDANIVDIRVDRAEMDASERFYIGYAYYTLSDIKGWVYKTDLIKALTLDKL